jgi:hypothetical protein
VLVRLASVGVNIFPHLTLTYLAKQLYKCALHSICKDSQPFKSTVLLLNEKKKYDPFPHTLTTVEYCTHLTKFWSETVKNTNSLEGLGKNWILKSF